MKILVVRLSSIGDIVLTTPVVRALRKKFPDAQIHYLTKPQYASILEPNPYVDKVINWDGDLKALFSSLKAERYDELIDLHRNIRTLRLKLALGKRGRTFRKLNLKKWVWTNFKMNLMPKVSIVDRYMDAVRSLGVTNDDEGLDYFLVEKDSENAEFANVDLSSPFAVLSIGGQYQTKRMPMDKWREVVKNVKLPCIVVGGKDESADAAALGEGIPHVMNLCGKLSLGNSAHLISKAAVVVTHDTGMMHVASAFHRPIVSIWGNTHPDLGMYAYLPKDPELDTRFEVEGLKCRPCSKIGHSKCPKGHFKCMLDQDTDAIAEAIERKKSQGL